MEIRLLGPLEAEVHGTSIVPSAGKPRQLLALLALHANHVLPVPLLIEELWGSDMPRSALTTLQTYVLQLRRGLGRAIGGERSGAAKDILATRHGGYLLHVEAAAVDVHCYERLVAVAKAEAAGGNDAAAVAHYRAALAKWRGAALVDVRVGPVLEIELARLEESQLSTLEARIETELRLGLHAELLTELTGLVARHPLHEGLHAQSMVALYRSGRQWQALEVYRGLRRRLVEDIGIEPSPRLQRLHEALLGSDPALDVPQAQRQHRAVLDLFAA